MCSGCGHNVEPDYTAWLQHVMVLHTLLEAGCTFTPNDLTMEEWFGVAEYKAALTALGLEKMNAPTGANTAGPPGLPRG